MTRFFILISEFNIEIGNDDLSWLDDSDSRNGQESDSIQPSAFCSKASPSRYSKRDHSPLVRTYKGLILMTFRFRE